MTTTQQLANGSAVALTVKGTKVTGHITVPPFEGLDGRTWVMVSYDGAIYKRLADNVRPPRGYAQQVCGTDEIYWSSELYPGGRS